MICFDFFISIMGLKLYSTGKDLAKLARSTMSSWLPLVSAYYRRTTDNTVQKPTLQLLVCRSEIAGQYSDGQHLPIGSELADGRCRTTTQAITADH